MESTYNKDGSEKYSIYLTLEEAELLERGDVVSGTFTGGQQFSISVKSPEYLKKIEGFVGGDPSRGTILAREEVLLVQHELHHMLYFNTQRFHFYEHLGRKEFLFTTKDSVLKKIHLYTELLDHES